MIVKKSPAEIERMARSGLVLAATHDLLRESAKAGVSTAELDRIAERFIREQGGVPTFKGYRGFPGSICASPNEMIVHGIPGDYRLKDGDIISLDVGVTLGGWVSDAAVTLAIGQIDADRERLLAVTEASLFAGVEQAVPGNRMGDLSAAVQRVCEEGGLSVVRSLVGHGVGREMHEDPQVPNYGAPGPRRAARRGDGPRDRADDDARRPRRARRRRRLGDLRPGRFADRALRVHRRDHRRRARVSSLRGTFRPPSARPRLRPRAAESDDAPDLLLLLCSVLPAGGPIGLPGVCPRPGSGSRTGSQSRVGRKSCRKGS